MARVKIYTSGFCFFCTMAKRLMDQRGVPYEEIRLDGLMADEREAVLNTTGMSSVPQIILDDTDVIGGYDQLTALDQAEGGLEKLK